MRVILGFWLVAVTACSSGLTTVPSATVPATDVVQTVPAISLDVAAELRARAFVIGCEDIACEGQPIFASDRIPQEVRAHIRNLLASEVSYLTDEEADEIMGPPTQGFCRAWELGSVLKRSRGRSDPMSSA